METKNLILQGVRWIAAEGMNAANNKPGKVRVGYGNTQACAVCAVALSEAPPHNGEGGLSVPQLAQWVVQKSRLRRSVEGRVLSLFSTAGAMDDGKIAPAALGE